MMTIQKQLLAFHDDPIQKIKFMSIMEKAVEEKRLISGDYWRESNCTGCLVGQIAHSDKHSKFASEINCPMWVPYLFDTIFEGLPDGERQKFAIDVMKAIPVGFSNWQSLYHKICIFNLEEICKNTDHPIVKQVIADILVLHKTEETDTAKWSAAVDAARSVATDTRFVVDAAMNAAADTRAAADAARFAVDAAWSASRSAEYAASRSAADAAWSAAAWSASRSDAYLKISKKIIELFGVCM